ncbi:phosphatase inhibitor-domain-containing protein [Mycena capillaripes]|nr:phosphatase inhibitor-domain-containing protein [Mycena capillaripes]
MYYYPTASPWTSRQRTAFPVIVLRLGPRRATASYTLQPSTMAYLATQRRPNTSAPGDGSRTLTITDAAPREDGSADDDSGERAPVGALHLTGGTRRTRQRVAWTEDVVDNEGCGRKSSKICCIYHKPKAFDESSDEDSSDSDADSDSSVDDRARWSRNSGTNRNPHQHNHPHPHPHPGPDAGGAAAAQRDPQVSAVTQLEEPVEPNAYEMVPSGKKGKGRRKSGSLPRR